jgi:hypothetical protein
MSKAFFGCWERIIEAGSELEVILLRACGVGGDSCLSQSDFQELSASDRDLYSVAWKFSLKTGSSI